MAINPVDIEILGDLANISTIVANLQGDGARESTSQLILAAVNGNIALARTILQVCIVNQQLLSIINEDLASTLEQLRSQIGSPQQAGAPVTLPASPPAGYGGASASEVWGATQPTLGRTYEQLMFDLGSFGIIAIGSGMAIVQGPSQWFSISAEGLFIGGDFPQSLPYFDPNQVLASDTIVTVLERLNPGSTWTTDSGSNLGHGVWVYSDGTATVQYQTTFSGVDLEAMKLANGSVVAPSPKVAPVWPGLSGVTLGTSVPLDTGLSVAETMSGVLIDVTSYPARLGGFTFDDVISVRNLGALAFYSDNGQEELPQLLGFQSAVYTPKSMQSAAGVKLRTTEDVVGTLTPFTINP